MGRALPVWAMLAACVCGTGKAGKRPRQPKAAGWVSSSWSFSPQMVPPWRRVVATGAADGGVRLWDVATDHERRVLSGQAGAVYAVAFTPDGRLVASASADGTTQLWDVGTGKVDTVLAGHTGPALTLAFSPDGALLASGGQDRSIRLTARQGGSISMGSAPAPPPVVASTPLAGGQRLPSDRPSPPSATTSDAR